MTWVAIDDIFPEHPKISDLSDAAFRAHVSAICYSARTLTDGYLPQGVLSRLRATRRISGELVRAGVWEADGQGYRIHDYLDYNFSRLEVERRRELRAGAGRAGGQRSGIVRRSKAEALASLPVEAKANPIPSHPIPPSETNVSSGVAPSRKPRKTLLTQEFLEGVAAEEPALDIPAFADDYLNWEGSRKHTDLQKGFRNQLRIGWKREQFAKEPRHESRTGNGRVAGTRAGNTDTALGADYSIEAVRTRPNYVRA